MNAKEWFSQQSFNGREEDSGVGPLTLTGQADAAKIRTRIPAEDFGPEAAGADFTVLAHIADDEQAPRICRRCGWEERGEERETYCRPDTLHDYPAEVDATIPQAARDTISTRAISG